MKKLYLVVTLLLLATLAYSQCLPPTVGGVPKTIGPGSAPDYFGCGNYANSPLPVRSCSISGKACFGDIECAAEVDPQNPSAVSTCSGAITGGGIHKFVDTLPGLTSAKENNLHQYIPVGVADTTTYQGSDYYEIAVVQYQEKMHSNLPPTTLRGYVQLETGVIQGNHYDLGNGYYGVDKPHYLGPTIVAQKDRPVRILFRNLLPTGQGGNLFVPVDTTVMGSGMGPEMGGMSETDASVVTDGARNPMCGETPKDSRCFSENRATLHLHGGITPWISDGTAHQWITPAGENTAYPKGVSVSNVPDMPDPGPGAMTFFYTNQQSARLMFYHDHAWGITRLNVYAGEAAGYLVTDATEQALMAPGGALDGLGLGIPLIIQDRTFVPTAEQLAVEDPTWDMAKWGGTGSVWVPHVYMPAQNPDDPTGANGFGRWMYGPWFWPPATPVYPPIPNPYFDPTCDPNTTWCQPRMIPGTPNQSVGMEHFNDTPIVNGTAYPTITLPAGEYRFRVLNAANDRFWNLQWYVADASGTEVALNPAELAAAQLDPVVFPTPDTSVSPAGPAWIQIGTEGGFLPDPVVIPNQPTTWITNPTRFDVGNVDQHSLLLAPAERADVIVDFTPFAGKTLILYNDAPAAFPARVASYDYYTGAPDQTDAGGAPSPQVGYGPNTRTVMQVKITGAAGTPSPNYVNQSRLAALQQAFQHHLDANNNPAGVFESSQDPIIVGQAAYNKAYGTNFRSAAPRDGIARIADFSMTFNTLVTGNTTSTLTIPFQPKALHDEMNSSDFDEYGRMTANIGLEVPNPGPRTQNVVLYPFVNPATEIFNGIELPAGSLKVTPIQTADDGTQIWRITHNGVDTHPIHFHLFNVQLLNRVTWDNIIIKPDANELGWKDTVRVSPLEDTIVALRPIVPKIPFGVPDSFRPLNPAMPLGNTMGFNNVDPNGNAINPPITNEIVNFGWEYVWHCHILGHEEMDMMRPMIARVSRALPAAPSVTIDSTGGNLTLTWTDGTPINWTPSTDFVNWGNPQNEVGYRIERASINNGVVGTYSTIGSTLANVTSFTTTGTGAASYRVVAYNAAGDSPSAPVTPGFIVSRTSINLGTQFVNTASAPMGTTTITNSSGAALAINSISAPAGVTVNNSCPASLANNQQCSFSLTFAPTVPGPVSGNVVISTSLGTKNVAVTGTAIAPVVTISRTSINLGAQLVNTTSAPMGTTTITNNTGAALTITSITAPAGVTVNNSCPASLANTRQCSFSVTFAPTVPGVVSGNVVITTSAGVFNVAVTGTAVAPAVTISRTSINLGTQLVNTTSAPMGTTTITNNTGAALTITSITAPAGVTVNNSCPASLASARQCSFSLTFAPTVPGVVSGNVVISTSAGAFNVAVTGTAVSPVAVSRTSINLGTQAVNTTSAPMGTTTITNNTAAAIAISSITAPAGVIVNNGCAASLASTRQCSFSLTFAPTVAGPVNGNVVISTSAGTFNVAVTGTAK